MKKIVALAAALFFLGCAGDKAPAPNDANLTAPPPQKPQISGAKTEIKQDLARNFSGDFSAVTPCDKCEGVKTIITLNKDKTYKKTMLFISNNPEFLTQEGNFSAENNLITLSANSGEQSYFEPYKNALAQLDEQKNKRAGVLAEIYNFKALDKDYKSGFFGEFFKLKNDKNFQAVIISPYKNGAKIDVYSNLDDSGEQLCDFEGEARYENGIFYVYAGEFKVDVHRVKDGIFINANSGAQICKTGYFTGKYSQKTDVLNTFGKYFLGELTPDMKSGDIIKIYGAKNIKKDARDRGENSHVVYQGGEAKFKYLLQNGVITRVEILSPSFKSPQGVGLGSTIAQVKSALKIKNFAFSDGQISLKIPSLNAVFKLENSQNLTSVKSLEQIPSSYKVDAIILNWNE